MKAFPIIFIIILIIPIACFRENNAESVLMKISEQMDIYPDSAYHSLKKMDVKSLSHADNALYSLLLVQAMDKNDIPLESDSLILVAVDYFKNVSDSFRKAQTYYYWGRYYETQDSLKQATMLYLRASSAVEKTKDYRLATLIYWNLGNIYYNRDWYEESLKMQRKALQYSKLDNNHNIEFVYRDIARCYFMEERDDSAFYYYQQALNSVDTIKRRELYVGLLNELGRSYYAIGNSALALEYVSHAINLGTDNNLYHYYLLKADIYNSLNNYDSIALYLKKALTSNDLYIKAASYIGLYRLEKEQNNWDFAIKYNDQYLFYRDSIEKIEQREEVIRIQQKYENEKLQNENNKLLLKYKDKVLVINRLVLFGVIAILGIILLYEIRKNRKENTLMLKELELKNKDLVLMMQAQELSILQKKTAILREHLYKKALAVRKIPSLDSLSQIEANAIDKKIYLSDRDWAELMQMADDVFDGFILKLKKEYPTLSQDDLQLCLLIRLKVSLDDLCNIYCVGKDAIKKRKQRLKKEHFLKINKNITLEDFIMNF